MYAPPIIEHTFWALGYRVTQHARSDFVTDSRLVMDSIDRGVPVITLEGVINCSDACVISGYDNDGGVLLGYSPFMHIEHDHNEAPDDTGYFRKTDWHGGGFTQGDLGRILIIEGKGEKPDSPAVLGETLKLAARLMGEENLTPGQHNGQSAHKAFANALLTYSWDDNFEPYLNVMCNYKQYLDRQYAVRFLRDQGRDDLARIYERIATCCARLGELIPQDFSAAGIFSDRERLRLYCTVLLQIADLEAEALARLG